MLLCWVFQLACSLACPDSVPTNSGFDLVQTATYGRLVSCSSSSLVPDIHVIPNYPIDTTTSSPHLLPSLYKSWRLLILRSCFSVQFA
jgi:hypothetical protein